MFDCSESSALQSMPETPVVSLAHPALTDMPRESAPRSAMEMASTSPAMPNPLVMRLTSDSVGAVTERSTSFSSYSSTPRDPTRPCINPSAHDDDPSYFYPGRGMLTCMTRFPA